MGTTASETSSAEQDNAWAVWSNERAEEPAAQYLPLRFRSRYTQRATKSITGVDSGDNNDDDSDGDDDGDDGDDDGAPAHRLRRGEGKKRENHF